MQAKRTQSQRQAIRTRDSLHTFLCGWPRGCGAVHALSFPGSKTHLEDFMHHSSPRHRPVSKVRQGQTTTNDSVPALNMQQSESYAILSSRVILPGLSCPVVPFMWWVIIWGQLYTTTLGPPIILGSSHKCRHLRHNTLGYRSSQHFIFINNSSTVSCPLSGLQK